MDPNDRPELAARLRHAREAAYRRGAEPDAVERLRALTEEASAARVDIRDDDDRSPAPAPAPTPTPAVDPDHAAEPGSAAPRRRSRPIAAAGIAGVLVGAAVGAALVSAAVPVAGGTTTATTAPPSAQQQLKERVVDSEGTLTAQDYYRFFPDDLPIAWGGASTGGSFTRLRGEATQRFSPAAASTSLLVVVTCPAADRLFSWTVEDDDGARVASGGDSCGDLAGRTVELRGARRPLLLRVRTNGPSTYSATVLER